MKAMTVTQARSNWSDLVNRVAFKGERIVLRRNGKNLVALVPADDAEVLEALEDRVDLAEARRRLHDGSEALDYKTVRVKLGLD